MVQSVLILFGVYALGGGLALLVNPGRMQQMIANFEDIPALSYITGAILAPLGAGILLVVHDFETLERGLVTFFGAAMLIEGGLMMIAPRTFLSLARPFIGQNALARAYGCAALAVSAGLLWLGFGA